MALMRADFWRIFKKRLIMWDKQLPDIARGLAGCTAFASPLAHGSVIQGRLYAVRHRTVFHLPAAGHLAQLFVIFYFLAVSAAGSAFGSPGSAFPVFLFFHRPYFGPDLCVGASILSGRRLAWRIILADRRNIHKITSCS